MPTVEKTSGGRVNIRPLDQWVSAGDRVDVTEEQAAYLCEERADFERVDGADSDSSAGDSDSVAVVENEDEANESKDVADPPLNPSDHTVDDLDAALGGGDYTDAELRALRAVESGGQDRSGALEAIDEHLGD